jgi:cell division protein FtsQ
MKLFGMREGSLSRRSARLWMLRFRKFGIMAAAVALVAGGGYYGWKHGSFSRAATLAHAEMLSTTSGAGFKVNEVIVTGRIHIKRDVILKQLAVKQGEPIFGVSVDAAQKALTEISWVKNVSVTRRLPDKLIIEITERKPAALWQYQKKISVIDADGRVLTSEDLDSFQSLPLVVGEDAPLHAVELLNLLKAEPSVEKELASAVRVGGRRWDLRLKNGLLVKLPENDTELALSRLAKEQEERKLFDKLITAVDLRIPDEMVIEPVNGGSAEDKNKKTI